MPDCAYYEELLSARLDGPLSPEEQAALDAHLAACPHCRSYAETLRALHEALPAMAQEPPAHLLGQIMDEVQKTAPAPKPKKFPRRWGGLACAAILALILLAAPLPLFTGGNLEESASTTETAEPAEGSDAGGTVSNGSDGSDTEESTAGSDLPESEYVALDTETGPDAPAESAPSAPQGPPSQDLSQEAGTQEAALKILKTHLQEQGRGGLTLTPAGLSEDGKSWLFTAETAGGAPVALFSVSQTTGQIREMPAAEEIKW